MATTTVPLMAHAALPLAHQPAQRVPSSAHTHEAMYLVELNRELGQKLDDARSREAGIKGELAETTGENERMEEQLRYLRGLQKNLVGIGQHHEGIATAALELRDVHQKRSRSVAGALRSGAIGALIFIPVLFSTLCSDGFDAVTEGPSVMLLLFATAALIASAKRERARRTAFRAQVEKGKAVLKDKREALKTFRKDCDFVSELIDSV